ncbi:MAG: diguanylate cyclase [Gammaproteobacteria bacterium]|nr:MAG: diguanylate cyclase [Gammaproteobacteria bacterium]TLZ02069.1 MAG: diguanylate cyclase [Gammaproteobacteria bacterium]
MQLPALRDGLRGLYNRRYLEDVFSRELHRVERNGKPVSVVMIISAPPTPPAAMAAKSLPSVGARFASPGNRLRLAPDRDSTATQRHAPSLTPR